MGHLTFLVTKSRKAVMSASSSRSGSCRHTSRIYAPFRTCRRPISAASSNPPRPISRRNRRLPSTLVRSPTITGRVSSSTTNASIPDTRLSPRCTGGRAAAPAALAASSRMCSGPVPQQPPVTFSQPASINRPMVLAIISGVSLYLPSSSGKPALGRQATGKRDKAARVRIWSVINSGPVAQLKPSHSKSRCISEV